MTISDTQLTDLLSQHSLQGNDLRLICELAEVDDLLSEAEGWTFEQFFGLTVYMFVTTELSHVRRQLARVIPRFGSRAVLSLIKILHQPDLPAELQLLARNALDQIAPYGLAYGLSKVLSTASQYETFALKALAELAHRQDESIMLLLSQLLSGERWQALEPRLLEWMPSDAAFDEAAVERERWVAVNAVEDTAYAA